MIITEKKIGRPTVRQAGRTIARVSPWHPLAAEMGGQVVRRVLDHDDRLIDQHADRDGDARQRHDVRGDAELPHEDERGEHGQRQGEADHHGAAEVHEDQEDGEPRR